MSWYSIVRRGGTTSTPWDPSLLSDKLLWLDADALSLANTDPVSTWSNAGSQNDFVQTTAALQPEFQTGVLNGLPGVYFDGSDEMECASFAMQAHASAFAVVSDSERAIWFEQSANAYSNEGLYLAVNLKNNPYLLRRGSDRNFSASAANDWTGAGAHQVGYVFQSVTAPDLMGSVYVDGSALTMTVEGGANLTNTTVTDSAYIGARTGGTAALNGYLHEILIVNATVSASERQQIEGYLAHKWGLTANLPVGHPYKTTAPTA